MTEQEIINAIKRVQVIGGMTVNEILFVCALMDEFDKVKTTNKNRAKEIVRWLRVDVPSIEMFVK